MEKIEKSPKTVELFLRISDLRAEMRISFWPLHLIRRALRTTRASLGFPPTAYQKKHKIAELNGND